MHDNITDYCTTECVDPQQCSNADPPCEFLQLETADDFAQYTNCTDVCGLYLDNLPNFDPSLFSAFKNLRRVIGHLSVTNNQYLYSLDFLANLTFVCISLFFIDDFFEQDAPC